jgi:hypothetical protein
VAERARPLLALAALLPLLAGCGHKSQELAFSTPKSDPLRASREMGALRRQQAAAVRGIQRATSGKEVAARVVRVAYITDRLAARAESTRGTPAQERAFALNAKGARDLARDLRAAAGRIRELDPGPALAYLNKVLRSSAGTGELRRANVMLLRANLARRR